MIGLLQRVTQAAITINGGVVASINNGLLVFIGIEKNDSEENAERLLKKLINYRVFADAEDKMNLSLKEVQGDLLLVPQFTLAADTRKGLRPAFSNCAPPELAQVLFDHLLDYAGEQITSVKAGVFGANMQISLNNDGPVTFWLQH